MERRTRLTEGSVGRHLYSLTMPMLFGISTMMAQALIDAWFIGQIGDRALAAYGFAYPIIMIVTSVAIGLGAGTSSVVARAVGRDDDERTRRLATDSLLLGFLAVAVIAVIGIATIDPLFTALGAPADMLPLIAGFMTILYLGMPFVVVGMIGMSSMRATGSSVLPGKLMVGAAIFNVILDPILIFGFGPVPELGLNGAAWAGLIARSTLFFGALWFMWKRLDLLTFEKAKFSAVLSSWRAILHVGVPAAATNIIVPLGAAAVTAMLARFGPDAVAGFGVASRIESMMLVLFYAMSSIIGPFVGQNLSAIREIRILRSLNLSVAFCLVSGALIAVFLAALSSVVPGWFSESEDVQRVTRLFLLIAPLSYGAYGIVMIMNAAFNGLGRPAPGVWVSAGRIIFLYVPLAWIGGELYGVVGIFAAYSLANIGSAIVAYLWARRIAIEECAAASR